MPAVNDLTDVIIFTGNDRLRCFSIFKSSENVANSEKKFQSQQMIVSLYFFNLKTFSICLG